MQVLLFSLLAVFHSRAVKVQSGMQYNRQKRFVSDPDFLMSPQTTYVLLETMLRAMQRGSRPKGK